MKDFGDKHLYTHLMFSVKKDIPTHTPSFNLEHHTYFNDTTPIFVALFWIPKQSSSQKNPNQKNPNPKTKSNNKHHQNNFIIKSC